MLRDLVINDLGTISWTGNNTTDDIDNDVGASITLGAAGTDVAIFNIAGGAGSKAAFSGTISGAGQLERTGGGHMVLSGTASHTGGSLLALGTTEVTGTLGGAVTVGDTLTLDVGTLTGDGNTTGTVTVVATGALQADHTGAGGEFSTVVVEDEGTVNPAGPVATGEIKVGSLTLTNTSQAPVLTFDAVTPASTDAIVIADDGTFSATGTTNVEVLVQGGWQVGDYILIEYGGTTVSPGVGAFNLLTGLGHASGGLVDTGSAIVLQITAAPTNSWTGLTDGEWDTTSANWGLVGSLFIDGDSVLFDDSATGTTDLNLDATFAPSTVSFANATKAYTLGSLGGFGEITGASTTLDLSGAADVTISTANTFGGGTTIGATSTLTLLEDPTTFVSGTVGSGAVVNDGALVLQRSETLANDISGSGTVEMDDAVLATTLSGTNSYDGLTTVTAGSLGVGSLTALGSTTAGTTVADAGQIRFDATLPGGGTVSEPLTLTGGTDTTIPDLLNSEPNLILNGSTTLLGDAVLSADSGTTLTLDVAVTGAGGIEKTGFGTILLMQPNTYAGNTTVTEGTLAITGDGTLGGGTNTVEAFAFLGLEGDVTAPFSTSLTGDGGLAKTGEGIATLDARFTSSLTGGVLLDGGTLVLTADNQLGGGLVELAGGELASSDPRIIGNDILLTGNPRFGDELDAYNGAITCNGVVDFGGDDDNIFVHAETIWDQGAINGAIGDKLGAETLTVRGTNDWILGDQNIEIRQGDLVLEGSLLNQRGMRIMATDPGGSCTLTIASGGSLSIASPTANLNVGYSAGNASGSNTLTLEGTLNVPEGNVRLGQQSTNATANIRNGGHAILEGFTQNNPAANTVINFDNGKVTVDAGAANSTFMQGFTAVSMLDGGLTIDTNGNDTVVNQAIQAGGTSIGGLTKQGAGTLSLGGVNLYGGPTVVEGGTLAVVTPGTTGVGDTSVLAGATLGGTGTVRANATVSGGISPGTSVGALTVVGQLAMEPGSSYEWEVANWIGILPGVSYDTIVVGSLDITATSGNPVTINVSELALANFSEIDTDFILAQTGSAITGFAADKFTIVDSGFPSGNGTWAVELDGNNLVLAYTAQELTDYEQWATDFGLDPATTGAPGADADNDSLNNDGEYAYGLSPVDGTSMNPISVPLAADSTFTYTRRGTDLTDLIYTIETSTTLQAESWVVDATARQVTDDPASAEVQTVVVTLTDAPTGDLVLFARVVASP